MPDLAAIAGALGAAAPALAATALRAAAALAVVAVVQAALARRTSAAVRHLVWAAALGVVLVLPVAEHPDVRAAVPAAVQVHRQPLGGAGRPTRPIPQPDRAAAMESPAVAADAPRGPGAAAAYRDAPATAAPADPFPWAAALVAVWAVGALLGLGRLAGSVVGATVATHRATPVPEWGTGVRRSSTAAVPYAWGVWRPVVVVPADFGAWPAPDRHAALAHEAAHVRRRDPLVGLVARVVRALHWFNPLAHYAVGRLDRERERAADDAVLGRGLDPADYAGLLVRSARRALAGRPAPRLAPAHAAPGRSALSERVGAVLDGGAQRGAPTRAVGLGTAGLALALAAALSAFGTARHARGAGVATAGAAADSAQVPAWYRPPPTAERWAPELHSADGWTFTPTFTPDLRTAYYVLWHAPDYHRPDTSIQELYAARWSDARAAWSPPERVAALAGWRVDWPHVSPDGRRLFVSTTKPHPGHYGYADGRSLPARTADFDLWAADLDAGGAPDGATLAPLDGPDLNRQKTPANARIGYVHNETAPRTDRAGRLYFWTERLDDGGGRRDVYAAESDGAGSWRRPALLPFNTARRESGVAVDPDGQWIIFASEGRGGSGRSDLFVVVRDGDGWAEPVNLGSEVNTVHREDSPEVSPDGRTLFFSTNRPGPGVPTVDAGEGAGPAASVFWVDLGAVPAFARATHPRPAP